MIAIIISLMLCVPGSSSFPVLTSGNISCGTFSSPTLVPPPPCRARTLDLRAFTCASSLTGSSNFSGVDCEGSLGFKAKGKGATPQAVDSLTSCRRELNQGISYESNFQDQMAYDTLQAYVDTCYNDALS